MTTSGTAAAHLSEYQFVVARIVVSGNRHKRIAYPYWCRFQSSFFSDVSGLTGAVECLILSGGLGKP